MGDAWRSIQRDDPGGRGGEGARSRWRGGPGLASARPCAFERRDRVAQPLDTRSAARCAAWAVRCRLRRPGRHEGRQRPARSRGGRSPAANAAPVSSHVVPSGFAAPIGSDEFVLLVPELDDAARPRVGRHARRRNARGAIRHRARRPRRGERHRGRRPLAAGRRPSLRVRRRRRARDGREGLPARRRLWQVSPPSSPASSTGFRRSSCSTLPQAR